MFGDWIRRVGFWTLDFIRGGVIRKDYVDVKNRLETGELNEKKLQQLLHHAMQTVPYYSKLHPKSFIEFPIVDKNVIKASWDELHSPQYKDMPIHYMATSGSTGTPFVMEWDMRKRKRQLAELIYFNEIAGQKLGQPYIYFRVWTEKNRKSKKELWMQNLTPVNILHLDENTLERIRKRLKSKPYINSCLAYASTYEYLEKYLTSVGDTPDMFHIKSIVSGSEVLSMKEKKALKDRLGCMVIDRYSNEENGFLAQSKDMSDVFDVNIASFRIEVLEQGSDEPVEIGEEGRIVVTDLYSFAVPLIRYDTGDLAIKEEEKDGWTTKLKAIQGRRVDVIYDTAGNPLTPHTWSVYMWKYEKLKQYQFIQEDAKRYRLKVNGGEEIYEDEEMEIYLKTVLGEEAEICIEHVDGIPALASGKFKKTVCLYHPETDGGVNRAGKDV